MTILHCPQVVNENGEDESVSNHVFVITSHALMAMICISDGLCKEHYSASLVITYR